jgi:acyl-CoA thioester hydrolase
VLLDGVGLVKEVYGWLPRAHVTVNYRSPVRFWDEVEVSVEVREMGRTSITYGFEIRSEGEPCADGTVVAVLIDEEGKPRPWPEEWRRMLLEAGPLPA